VFRKVQYINALHPVTILSKFSELNTGKNENFKILYLAKKWLTFLKEKNENNEIISM